jgi:hypothetical protein
MHRKSHFHSDSFSFQTGVLAGRMLFESPWGHRKSHFHNDSFSFQTGVLAGRMLFESPWMHKKRVIVVMTLFFFTPLAGLPRLEVSA